MDSSSHARTSSPSWVDVPPISSTTTSKVSNGWPCQLARDMAKQSVLDLTPLAGSWRVVTHFHDQAGVIGEFLQFELPQSATGPIASAVVRRNQESFGTGVFFSTQFLPPPTNRGDREGRRVMTDADRASIAAQRRRPRSSRSTMRSIYLVRIQ